MNSISDGEAEVNNQVSSPLRREDVIRLIVAREQSKRGVFQEAVSCEAPDLYAAACKHFGTWSTALRYAGISLRQASKSQKYELNRVLSRIRNLCIRGYDMSNKRSMTRDRQLYESAIQHFGTWQQALSAAGLQLDNAYVDRSTPRLDAQQIVAAILQRHQLGLSLTRSTVVLENRVLVMAAKSTFGNWSRALLAAGLDPVSAFGIDRKVWDKQQIIAAIRLRQQEGKTLNHAAALKEASALVSAARRYFGGWNEALAEAGAAKI